MYDDELADYVGFRHMLAEEKIEECLAAARRGETSVEIDTGDLNAEEIAYIKKQVRRRIDRGED